MDRGAWWAIVQGVTKSQRQCPAGKKRGGNDAQNQARGGSLTSTRHSGVAELGGSEGPGLQRWKHPKYPVPGTRGSLTGGRSSQMQRQWPLQDTPCGERQGVWRKWGHARRDTQTITDHLGRTLTLRMGLQGMPVEKGPGPHSAWGPLGKGGAGVQGGKGWSL